MSSPSDKRPESAAGSAGDDAAERVRFHYLKSSTFHSIHADGVFGGVTPSGSIHIAFFAERFPIPTQVDVAFDSEGKPGEIPGTRVLRDGIVRELQADVFLTLTGAEALHDWLGKHLEKLRAVSGQRE
jgi:hypothetical protein